LEEERYDEARMQLAGAGDCESARTLSGLITLGNALRQDLLTRILWCPGFEAPKGVDEVVCVALETADAVAMVQERAELIDLLLADRRRHRPVFGHALAGALQDLTGVADKDVDLERWWAARRPHATGEPAQRWAFARMLDAWCLESARKIATGHPDWQLREAADLAVAATTVKQWDSLAEALKAMGAQWALLPRVADEMGLLLIDSRLPQLMGTGRLVERLRRRLTMVEYVNAMWQECDDALSTTGPFLGAALTGAPEAHAGSSAAFAEWWRDERPRQTAFEEHFQAGMLAAGIAQWDSAEVAFAQACKDQPERQCAQSNHATALIRLRRFEEADTILIRLVADEPEESLWRVQRGDTLLAREMTADALACYERAQALGNNSPSLSLRLGVCLLQLGRKQEARFYLDEPFPNQSVLTDLEPLMDGRFSWSRVDGEEDDD